MKKNTLLYLDKMLVEKAKKKGLNISEITENGIKTALNINYEKFNPAEHLETLLNDGRAYYTPIPIKVIIARNIGPIRSFRIDLKKNNMVVGGNATGKTILCRSIKKAIENRLESGEINIHFDSYKMMPNGPGLLPINESFNQTKVPRMNVCLVIDGGLDLLSDEKRKTFVRYLVDLKVQKLLTSLKETDYERRVFQIVYLEKRAK